RKSRAWSSAITIMTAPRKRSTLGVRPGLAEPTCSTRPSLADFRAISRYASIAGAFLLQLPRHARALRRPYARDEARALARDLARHGGLWGGARLLLGRRRQRVRPGDGPRGPGGEGHRDDRGEPQPGAVRERGGDSDRQADRRAPRAGR